jgi:hypothetical protein
MYLQQLAVPKAWIEKVLFWDVVTLVGKFKFFSTIYSEKCRLFFRHFSVKISAFFSVKNV